MKRIIVLISLCLVPVIALIACRSETTTPSAKLGMVVPTPTDLGTPEQGATRWVNWQGSWTYQPTSNATVDNVTVASAAPSPGQWLREPTGWPGAEYVTAWYVDSAAGNDANDCQAPGAAPAPGGHGACADPSEVFRRLRSRKLNIQTTVMLAGDFSARSYTFGIEAASGGSVVLKGTRTYTNDAGAPLFAGTVTGYVAWDGGAHQEGVATVAGDGGVFNPVAMNTEQGTWLEVGDAGMGMLVGEPRDAGTFATPGGYIYNTYNAAEPSIGDPARAYTLTPLATAPGQTVTFAGGPIYVRDLQVGSTTHATVVATPGGPGRGVAFESSQVRGLDDFEGSYVFANGSDFMGGVPSGSGANHFYGHGASITACLFDLVQVRHGGMLELYNHNLIQHYVIWVGGRDGPGYLEIDGPTAVLSYSGVAALYLQDGTRAYLSAPFWGRNAIGGTPFIRAYSGSVVIYEPSTVPAVVGAAAALPWGAGNAWGSTLPLEGSMLAGILPNQ